MAKSDLLKRIEDTISRKEINGVSAMSSAEFIKALEDFISHKDSKSRFFSARFHPVGEDHDAGMVIIKFASGKKNQPHNEIMKNAKTKFVIAIDGFDRQGKCSGNGRCKLQYFSKLNPNGERREWDELKHVNTEGTHSEILKHLLNYFDKNLLGFTDSAIRYKKGEETEQFHENGVSGGGVVSSATNVGSQSDTINTDNADGIDQTTASGISRVKTKLFGDNIERRKKKTNKKME
jgi:hypothetical protein